MMGVLVISHLFSEIIALVLLMGVVIVTSWAEKAHRPSERYTCVVVRGLRAFAFMVLAPFGLMFWDTVVKQLFLGVFGYGNVMHWMGEMILLGFVGTAFIMAAAFVAPSRKAIATFAVMAITFFYLVYFYYPSAAFTERLTALYTVLYTFAAGFICQVTMAVSHGIYLRARRSGKLDTPLWDISPAFKRVFSRKVVAGLMLLTFLAFMLSFEGYGLLSYLTVDGFLGIVVGAAGGVAFFLVVKSLRAGRKLLRDEWAGKHFPRTDKLVRTEEKLAMPDGEVLQGFVYTSATSPGGPESAEKKPGPAILFLHGFGGFAQDLNFEPMLSSFAMAGYTVFAYDYRWSGHSRKPGQSGPFQGVIKEGPLLFEHFASDANTALSWVLSHADLVDPKRVAVVGFSMGGLIALSPGIYADPRVKVIVAGCALHDLGENIKKRIMGGSFILRLFGWFMALRIRARMKITEEEFLARCSKVSPSSASGGLPPGVPPSSQRVFLAHCKDDSFVNYEMNFAKNKAMLGLPDANCLVFESGDHVFLHNELALGSWVFYQLHRRL
ncbi:MAG: alpha/beta hydrolase [Candidatus Lokiarchaeota archaeon]|nr:alpha/beta hydrolase [Candidatus Lokiarchaeota archaeon]